MGGLMSYAIFDLALEAPPATALRFKTSEGLRWVVRCELCGRRSTPRPLLSAAMRSQYAHGREHYRDMLLRHAERIVHKRRPLPPPNGGQPLAPNATDRVHLPYNKRKAS